MSYSLNNRTVCLCNNVIFHRPTSNKCLIKICFAIEIQGSYGGEDDHAVHLDFGTV